ncbi:MAG: hypothetical protein JRI68_08945 [Deltaproteobacteria bacterium]|nr:hypothetical protein [Deltaproteobacteria bacterium]
MTQRQLALTGVVLLALAGCSSGDDEALPQVTAIYSVPGLVTELADESYLDHPLPSDFRRDPDGSARFLGFHNPRNKPIIAEYLDATEGLLDGFSPVAPGYLRFDGPLDPASLPQSPADALYPGATVQLVDVDPDSPEVQQRKLIDVSFRGPGGVYVLPNTLRWMPALGFPLRPATRYALVVTTGAAGATGQAVGPSIELSQVLGIDLAEGPRAAVRDDWQPAVDVLGEVGIGAAAIAHLAVFTTNDPTAETIAVADHLRSGAVAAPDFGDEASWTVSSHTGYVEYQGTYGPSPNYQRGELPFEQYGDGGELNFVGGQPEVVDTFDLRFSLTVPDSSSCPMPAEGYPIVLYAHGTGGSWRSYLGYGDTFAEKCIAAMGVDQIFHGTRPGAPDNVMDVQLLFFNFQNVDAARSNGRQSAIDEVQRARLFTETGATIPAAVSHTGEEIRFDGSKVMFMGHSQGGLNGPLYLAVDDSARGGVLSGSSSVMLLTLLEKNEPQPSVAGLVRTIFLGLAPEEFDEVDVFHPALGLAQTLVDAIDPINYARLTVLEPRSTGSPKSILMTEGIGPDGVGDNYAPPRGTEAQAIAMGLPLQLPAQLPYEQLDYGAPPAVDIPSAGLSGNLADGNASGVLAQWAPAAGEDGHFVVFDVPAARAQVAEFVRRLADDPAGSVPAP